APVNHPSRQHAHGDRPRPRLWLGPVLGGGLGTEPGTLDGHTDCGAELAQKPTVGVSAATLPLCPCGRRKDDKEKAKPADGVRHCWSQWSREDHVCFGVPAALRAVPGVSE